MFDHQTAKEPCVLQLKVQLFINFLEQKQNRLTLKP